MRLYNTLTRKIEKFSPQQPPDVGVYTCGPTVYDYPHIGNWFTFIRYDTLIRVLKSAGFKPTWVMNITDVGHLVSDADEGEDKLEKGARREGKTAWEVANFYSEYFTSGLSRLGFTQPTYLPRATDHIAEQIELIKKLEQKGFAYIIDDGVYYDTEKFSHYGEFARLDLDEQQARGRLEANPQKHRATDFALWKFSPKDKTRDMEWDSPWGKGFPGWHIECSAMCLKYLGETIDIHSGGIDHIPVHHTNEIAQSSAMTNKPLANFWMHSNHITVEGEKISKSLGNGITLEEIEKKNISLDAFRLHVLESHYRSLSKFSWQSLQAAENRLNGLHAMADLRWQPKAAAKTEIDFRSAAESLATTLQDDLNTPGVLAELSATQNVLENSLLNPGDIEAFEALLKVTESLTGLSLLRPDINPAQRQLIAERETARQDQDWDHSDILRKQLQQQKIGVRDTPLGPVWYRL